jgi:hypothetical protein
VSVAQVRGQSQKVTRSMRIAYGATLQSAYCLKVAQAMEPWPLVGFQAQGNTF